MASVMRHMQREQQEPARAGLLELSGVSHRFLGADARVFENVDLSIANGEFIAVVGGSGVGKSTLLRNIAGLLPASEGQIVYSGEQRQGRRNLAVVFQDGRLLPWRTLAGNIEFGLEGLGLSADERRRRIEQVLELTRIGELADRWPHQLSGGQLQRGGIARALAVQPDLLLMDEPFSAVDAITRQVLQDELLRIWQASDAAVLFVTHDIQEAILLADRVVIMGGHPATITRDTPINLARPRQRDDVNLFRLASDIAAAI